MSSAVRAVTWSATSPESGRYAGVFVTTPGAELLTRIAELRENGAGYCEVEVLGQRFPRLSVSFRGDQAVIERWTGEKQMALLGGDGTVAADDVVELPIMDDEDPGRFTGEYVSSTDRAVAVLKRFFSGGDTEILGDWYDL